MRGRTPHQNYTYHAVNRAPQTEGSRVQRWLANHALAQGLTTDPMSLTMVRARQYNGICVSRRETNHVLVRMAVFLSDQLVGATQG